MTESFILVKTLGTFFSLEPPNYPVGCVEIPMEQRRHRAIRILGQEGDPCLLDRGPCKDQGLDFANRGIAQRPGDPQNWLLPSRWGRCVALATKNNDQEKVAFYFLVVDWAFLSNPKAGNLGRWRGLCVLSSKPGNPLCFLSPPLLYSFISYWLSLSSSLNLTEREMQWLYTWRSCRFAA